MCSEYDVNRQGFTLFELLVAVGIVVLLAGLTLGSLRASRTHQSLEQAGARLRMLTDIAAAHARSGGEPVYLAVAGHGAEPEHAAFRAHTLIRDLDDPELLRDWEFLPPEMVFAPAEDPGVFDLMDREPVEVLSNPFADDDIGGVTGPVRVLIHVEPDGRFLVGRDREPKPAALTLRRGRWIEGATVNPDLEFVPWEDPERAAEDTEVNVLQIRFRPLTGVVVSERVYP